jgi:AhpD family alkylhydroperoxidase
MGLCIAVTKPNEYMINFQQRRLRKVEIDENAEEEALLVTGLFEGLDGFAHALQVESDLQPGRVLAGDTTRSGRIRVGNVPYVEITEDPFIREIYQDILAHLEVPAVPKIFEAMAHQPVILQTRWDFYKTIMLQGVLPRRTKELIAVAVSAINEGSYCIDANSAAGRQYGLSEKGLVEAACVIDLFGNLCTLAKGFRLAKRNF